jgi:hypothetical protein
VRAAIGLIIIAAVVITIVALLWRRRTRDEIHSIDHYRNALETLHGMRPDTASTSVRVLDPDEAKSLRQPHAQQVIRSSNRGLPPPTIAVPPDARDGMVFDDANPPPAGPLDEDPHRGHDSSQWAISRAQSHPPLQNRQWMAMGIATAIVLVLLVVGVLVGRSSHTSSRAVTTTTSHGTVKKRSSTTTTAAPKVTTTTAPTSYQPQAGASTTAATYIAPSTRYVLTITATGGGCWTVANSLPANTQLFAGTVAPGSPESLAVNGGILVTLGAPGNVSITLNGRPVVFPTGYQTPLALTFQPPAPPTPTTTTSAPAVTTTTVAPTTTAVTQKP